MSLYRRCLSARDKLDVVVVFIYCICNKIKKKRKQITLRNVPYFAKKKFIFSQSSLIAESALFLNCLKCSFFSANKWVNPVCFVNHFDVKML
jgi:hypothetical protein